MINNNKKLVVYVKSEFLKNYIILQGDVNSFRCRQRNINIDNTRVKSLNFVSYQQMKKNEKKNNKKIYGKFDFNTICKL